MFLRNEIFIRAAKKKDLSSVANAISSSFCDDPVFIWMVSDLTERAERKKIAIEFFELYVSFALEHGVVHLADTTKSGVVGATIWLPHDADDASLADEIDRIADVHAPRFRMFAEILGAHYPPVAPFDKLMAIATHPSTQGMGIGSALIGHRLHELDHIGIPTYLEATTRHAAGGVYERFGYQPIGEPVRFPGGSEAFPMWRNAYEAASSVNIYGLDGGEMRLMQFANRNWRILDKHDGRMLLILDKVIEKKPYHSEYTPVTWANCSLRQYLNDSFFDTFDSESKDKIIETEISNANNPWFGINGGADTMDRIFLLSIEETVRYFGDSRQLRNKNRNTKYFINDNFNYVRKAVDSVGTAACWWLRTPGNTPSFAANVASDGRIVVSGDFVNRSSCMGGGIRPALWLKV